MRFKYAFLRKDFYCNTPKIEIHRIEEDTLFDIYKKYKFHWIENYLVFNLNIDNKEGETLLRYDRPEYKNLSRPTEYKKFIEGLHEGSIAILDYIKTTRPQSIGKTHESKGLRIKYEYTEPWYRRLLGNEDQKVLMMLTYKENDGFSYSYRNFNFITTEVKPIERSYINYPIEIIHKN